MAGFGWNSRHENVQGFNHARQEPCTSQIACRICDAVFMSNKALLDHVELHPLLGEAAATRQTLLNHLSSSQRILFANHFHHSSPLISTPQEQPRAASSMLPTEINPFSLGTHSRNVDLQPAAPSLSPISFAESRNDYMPLIQTQQLTANGATENFVPEPRNLYFTRPFLNQLEATLLVDGMASLVDREMSAKSDDEPILDVTLKL